MAGENKKVARYAELYKLVDKYKPQTICEIGTWKGMRARKMLRHASYFHKNPHYIGYDLFDDATEELNKKEWNGKGNYTIKVVDDYINQYNTNEKLNATWKLHKGNTNDILVDTVVDFAFIDGGHSVETIANDYSKLKDSKVIVFDDYYMPGQDDKVHVDINLWGANKLVDSIDKTKYIIDVGDRIIKDGVHVANVCLAVIENDTQNIS